MIQRRPPANTARFGLVCAILLGSCLDEPTPPQGALVSRLEIVAPDSALLVGYCLQLGARAWDSVGNPVPSVGLIWWSSDTTLLRVDGMGLAQAPSSTTGGDVVIRVAAPPSPTVGVLRVHVAVHGELKWRLPLGSMPIFGGPAEGPDGTIYVLGQTTLDSQAILFAVSPRGAIQWQRSLIQVDITNYPLVGVDGTVFVVGQYVYAYTSDGNPRWALTTRPSEDPPNLPDAHSGAVSTDGVLYASMGYDLLALGAARGDTIWEGPRAADAAWLLPPSISATGATVYLKQTGDTLYARRASDGVALWGVRDPDDTAANNVSFGQGPALSGSRVIIPLAGQLYEVDTFGNPVGLGPRCGFGLSEPAVAPDGTLYVQYTGCGMQGYRPVSAQLWRSTVIRSRWPWYGGPALASAGILYTAAIDGLYALDVSPSGATKRWRYPPLPQDSLVFVGAPLIGRDGTVYSFTSCDAARESLPCSDELFAFWEDKLIEPNSPWPMWRHDARRSGQAHR